MYFMIAKRLLKKFEMVSIRRVPRIENQKASDLAQIASGYKVSKDKFQDAIEVRGRVVSSRLSLLDF